MESVLTVELRLLAVGPGAAAPDDRKLRRLDDRWFVLGWRRLLLSVKHETEQF